MHWLQSTESLLSTKVKNEHHQRSGVDAIRHCRTRSVSRNSSPGRGRFLQQHGRPYDQRMGSAFRRCFLSSGRSIGVRELPRPDSAGRSFRRVARWGEILRDSLFEGKREGRMKHRPRPSGCKRRFIRNLYRKLRQIQPRCIENCSTHRRNRKGRLVLNMANTCKGKRSRKNRWGGRFGNLCQTFQGQRKSNSGALIYNDQSAD